MKSIFAVCAVMMALLLTGCATPVATDYTDFKQSKPKSILVLLPQNQSPEVDASHGVLSQVTYPLAEAGYYVLPVAVVEETFKQNGMTNAGDISAASPPSCAKSLVQMRCCTSLSCNTVPLIRSSPAIPA